MMFPTRPFVTLCAALALSACGGGDDDAVTLPSPQALCASQGLTPKIANGATCSAPEKSPVILLFSVATDGSVSVCSGTLVTPTAVVSAAHCIPAGTRRVVAVQWRADGSTTNVNASAFVAHPGYTETPTALLNDVAVIRLRSALSNPTMPVLVSQPAAAGQSVYVSGWGFPGFDLAVGLAQLQRVDAAQLGFVYDGALSNACQGDSGGPMYRSVEGGLGLIGVTSSGSKENCEVGDNALFTNLQSPGILGFLQAQIPGLPTR